MPRRKYNFYNNHNFMKTTLIDIKGWDLIVENDLLYFQRINDKLGKQISFHKYDLSSIFTITEEEFNIAKFGKNHNKFLSLIGTNTDYSAKQSDGSIICTGFMDYFFYFIDKDGNIKEKREDIGFDNIYSFDIDKNNNIWFAIPTAHYVGQYSLELSKEIFHLGEKYEENKPLFLPEDVKIYDDFAYISDMNNNRILRIKIQTKEWIEYLKFNEETWEYRQFKGNEIVRLQSGIYLVEK